MFKIPLDNEPQEQVVDSRMFYICKKEHNNRKGMWVRHKLEDYNSSKFQSIKELTRKGNDTENNRN